MLVRRAQVSMLLTGCVANGHLGRMTFIDCDSELGSVIDEDDDVDDEMRNATATDTVRETVVPSSIGIDRR